MYYKLISYFKFLLKSTNAHGVHSPFIYTFVTKCLYSKPKLHPNKSRNVLLKSVGYFNFKKLQIENSPEIETLIQGKFERIAFDGVQIDLLFTEQINPSRFMVLLSEGKLHNNSMILIDGIHQDKQKQQSWEKLIASPNITVSMDMFHCGAIFIRGEQEKEHFTIRI